MQKEIDLFSNLLREMEVEIGTRDTSSLVLIALTDAVKALKVKSPDDFCLQFKELVEIISSTEPKFGILNYHFGSLLKNFKEVICGGKRTEKKWRSIVIKSIDEITKTSNAQKDRLIEFSEELNIEGKSILIHDHSHTVQDVLVHYRNMGKHFKVVIAEQDFDKTHGNIEKMYAAQIPFQVVPAYMLSHVHKTIDMLFFGALTLKDTMHFVMDPGTHGIISEFHVEHVPSYMFIDTTKFSLWKSKPRGEIFIHKHMRQHVSKPIEYERIKYSHDRVPADLFHRIVTNEGIFTPAELQKLFDKKYKEYQRVLG